MDPKNSAQILQVLAELKEKLNRPSLVNKIAQEKLDEILMLNGQETEFKAQLEQL